MNFLKKKDPFKINGSIEATDFSNEKLFYEIIKRLIILINENLPAKIRTSNEFQEILILAETIKKQLESN